MGLLIIGKPMKWRNMQKYKKHVKRHGIAQFINVWRRAKDRRQDKFLWGDEIEGLVLVRDPAIPKMRLSLRAKEILQDLEAAEAKARELDPSVKWNVTFHPEYGCFMVEATPASPYGGYTSDLRLVEPNMRLRRALIESVLRPGEVFVTLTNFPQMGVADFTSPPLPPRGPVLKSAYIPDGVMSPHPRFAALSGNIRRRRGCRVNIKVPLFIDKNTLKSTEDATKPAIVPDEMAESDDEALPTSPVRVERVFSTETSGCASCNCNQEVGSAKENSNPPTAWSTSRTVCVPVPPSVVTASNGSSIHIFDQDTKLPTTLAVSTESKMCSACASIRVSPEAAINSTPIELARIADHVRAQADNPAVDAASLLPATDKQIHMDAMGFGMGCCCLQVTFQTRSIEEARHLYDQLAVVSPILLALTANTPFFRGRIADTDVRWDVISMSVDDRTPDERGFKDGMLPAITQEADLERKSVEERDEEGEVYNDVTNESNVNVGSELHPTVGVASTAPHGLLRKPRYSSIDCYLGQDLAALGGTSVDPARLVSRPSLYHDRYNDLEFKYDAPSYRQLREAGVDELLAKHIASLFVRDPLVMFEGKINVDDEQTTEHFESVQSTNWRSVRFKPPPLGSDIGWRVEFRTMEVQMTDFENAAFTVFIALLTRAISFFHLNFYIPLTKVEENFAAAHQRDAVNTQKFYFRKTIRAGLRKRTGPSVYSFAQAPHHATPQGNTMNDLDAESWHFSPVTEVPDSTTSEEVASLASSGAGEDYYDSMTMAEIFVGKPSVDYPGLLPLVRSYLDIIKCDTATRQLLDRYLALVELRALGILMTGASWMRRFVEFHPSYKHDSVLTDDIVADLAAVAHHLAAGSVVCPELLGDLHEPSFTVSTSQPVIASVPEERDLVVPSTSSSAKQEPVDANTSAKTRFIRVPSSSSSLAAMQALGCCSSDDEDAEPTKPSCSSTCVSTTYTPCTNVRPPCASLACPVAGPACSYASTRQPHPETLIPSVSGELASTAPLVLKTPLTIHATAADPSLVPPHPLQEDEPLLPQPLLPTGKLNVPSDSLPVSGVTGTAILQREKAPTGVTLFATAASSPYARLTTALASHYQETRQLLDGVSLNFSDATESTAEVKQSSSIEDGLAGSQCSEVTSVPLRGAAFSPDTTLVDKRLKSLLRKYTMSASVRAASAAFDAARAEAEAAKVQKPRVQAKSEPQ